MITKTLAASFILLGLVPATAGTTVPSLTNPQPVATSASGWQYRMSLYGWLEALEGDVTLRGRNVPVDMGFSDVLDHLDYAFMAAAEVGCGKWSLLSDLIVARISGSTDTRLTHIDTQLDQFIGSFVAVYEITHTMSTSFDLYAGARVNSLDVELDVDTQNLGSINESGSQTWVDPIMGFRLQQQLSDRVYLRALADIGGFGASSDLTWCAMVAFGYQINDHGAVVLGYRGIGADYTNGDFGYDVITHGAMLGFEYKF